ncbi:glutathione peroxidase [Hydrogenophaga palleronii]|uniref:glutathione peroxidase n=1 Tax=Hydrogenophaga palleronii TaxID=65655 RepID=UPI000824272C|nr:glutathione peroxidase [Hydrogenophaga palleronii]
MNLPETPRPSRSTRATALASLLLGLGAAATGLPAAAQTPSPPQAAAAAPACPTLLQHGFDRLQDEKPQSLCQYTGKVVLVVNTASFCGFTKQYEGLEDLHARYQARGLVVLGFPSNDFGNQEPGNNQAIADFCENTFGVKFPMFSKTSVVGRNTNPLFRQLAAKTGESPRWNFHKYLIGRDGQTVHSYGSGVEPKNPALVKDIEKLLEAKM